MARPPRPRCASAVVNIATIGGLQPVLESLRDGCSCGVAGALLFSPHQPARPISHLVPLQPALALARLCDEQASRANVTGKSSGKVALGGRAALATMTLTNLSSAKASKSSCHGRRSLRARSRLFKLPVLTWGNADLLSRRVALRVFFRGFLAYTEGVELGRLCSHTPQERFTQAGCRVGSCMSEPRRMVFIPSALARNELGGHPHYGLAPEVLRVLQGA